ncbi:MAG TPA: LysR family transcriptional regulator [Elusimicrobiales bacterium]|nr:LysR family transcriptional regulator [Elusimicrobiales bacterium]
MKLKTKVWFEEKGKLVFGFGKSNILKAVVKYGSLNEAAKKLNMSYRSVWSHVKAIEKRFGKELVIKTKGGKSGGGAQLTQTAKQLITKYDKLDADIKKYADKCFKRVFK